MNDANLPVRPQPKPEILEISPYVPGKSEASGGKVYKLSSNESALGAGPKAIAAFAACAKAVNLYPDGSASVLREAIAARYRLNAANIVCGAGSDELLQLIAHAFLAPGDEAVYSQHGFLVYPIAIKANGATSVVAPEIDYRTNVDAMIAAITPKTRVIFLANPNNPTGTYVAASEVRRLHAAVPKDCLLVLDAAYAEYVRRNDYESGMELVSTFENVVMTRTFSKIFGLAGLRLGWAYCPSHVADALNRVRGPFNVSSPALAAGAAAIADLAHVEQALAHNDEWLTWLRRELEALGLRVTPSVGNFLLVHFPSGEKSAAKADAFLSSRGLILRRMEAYGIPGALRLTVGTPGANRALIAALKEFIA